ncbi:hypothetical protein Y888_15970 [Mixta calida B021323]|nr:hypothetical protein Y888_15970 [Mixta calida B021323]
MAAPVQQKAWRTAATIAVADERGKRRVMFTVAISAEEKSVGAYG